MSAIESSLRRLLGRAALEQIWSRNGDVDPEFAYQVASEEVRAHRDS